jgi:hypothetical protein
MAQIINNIDNVLDIIQNIRATLAHWRMCGFSTEVEKAINKADRDMEIAENSIKSLLNIWCESGDGTTTPISPEIRSQKNL